MQIKPIINLSLITAIAYISINKDILDQRKDLTQNQKESLPDFPSTSPSLIKTAIGTTSTVGHFSHPIEYKTNEGQADCSYYCFDVSQSRYHKLFSYKV